MDRRSSAFRSSDRITVAVRIGVVGRVGRIAPTTIRSDRAVISSGGPHPPPPSWQTRSDPRLWRQRRRTAWPWQANQAARDDTCGRDGHFGRCSEPGDTRGNRHALLEQCFAWAGVHDQARRRSSSSKSRRCAFAEGSAAQRH
eukprot:4313510-Pyramimonas_sp.AAC.1